MRLCGLLAGYERCEFRCSHYRQIRGSSYGIAVDDDYHAKEFQKWDRRRLKCFNTLDTRLYKIDKKRKEVNKKDDKNT